MGVFVVGMSDESLNLPIIALTIIIGIVFVFIYWITGIFRSTDAGQESNDKKSGKDEKTEKGSSKKRVASGGRWSKENKKSFNHPWVLTSLKGHSGRVLDMDFSQNGKYLASCAEDRSVLIWLTKDFTESQHRSVRGNVAYDHAVKVKWSPDTKAYMVHKAKDNCLQIYKLSKKPDGMLGNVTPALQFPQKHEKDIVGCGMACSGKFIMSCSAGTDLIVWDLKGDVLATIDTLQMSTNSAQVSPCGRFIATSGFTPDVKVWEAEFNKSGNFEKIARAFELKGHTAAVTSFCFNNDSTRVATVSKDGTWRLHDTEIDYRKGQEPYLLKSGEFEPVEHKNALIALSPDGRSIAIATGHHLAFYSGVSGKKDMYIKDVHTDDITCLAFDQLGKYLVTTGDRQIKVFHNITGYNAIIQDLEEKKKSVGSTSQRERMDAQIKAAKKALKEINV